MQWSLRVSQLAGLLALSSAVSAADLIPPVSVAVTGITVAAQPQIVASASQVLAIDKARARTGWQLTVTVVNGQLVHTGSSFVIPASVRFTSITALYGANTDGISISGDGATITSGPYKSNRTYQANFLATLNVPALPRAGSYSGTINFVITEF